VARVTITRTVAADPASVALLMAGPDGASDELTLGPPRRTGVGFVASVTLRSGPAGTTSGAVTVEPAADSGAVVRLLLDAGEGTAAKAVERLGTNFLSELTLRARSRSYAA
jgi:hypothetical protein